MRDEIIPLDLQQEQWKAANRQRQQRSVCPTTPPKQGRGAAGGPIARPVVLEHRFRLETSLLLETPSTVPGIGALRRQASALAGRAVKTL